MTSRTIAGGLLLRRRTVLALPALLLVLRPARATARPVADSGQFFADGTDFRDRPDAATLMRPGQTRK